VTIATLAKRSLPSPLWRVIRAYGNAILTPIEFSRSSGHWKSSLKGKAVCCCGKPLPWYSYSMIDFLKDKDFSERRILEFGAGQSTLWWAERAREVVSIECNPDWVEEVTAQAPANVTVAHFPINHHVSRDISEAAQYLRALGKFDLIVVDAPPRAEFTELAFELASDDGAIILENADQASHGYEEALRGTDWHRIDFWGYCPGVKDKLSTALAFREHCFLF
jgi:hypothetical protein